MKRLFLLRCAIGVLTICLVGMFSAGILHAQNSSTIDEKAKTSDFHRADVGKILFSKTPIVIGKENPAQFTTQFTANDKIYAVAYLGKSLKQLTGKSKDASGVYMYTVDNEPNSNQSGVISFTHNDADLNQSWYSIEIMPDPDKALHGLDAMEWYNAFTRLEPTKHTLKIDFTSEKGNSGDYAAAFASGEITIDLTGMNLEVMRANAESASEKAKDNWARNNTTLPDWLSKPSKKFADPELNTANLQAIFQRRWAAEGRQVLKIITAENPPHEEWVLYKNDLGLPKEKVTGGKVGILFKAKDGWCYFIENVYFRRDYTGGGTFGKVIYHAEGESTKIDCDRVK